MGLVAGNRVTTCNDESAKDGAVIGIEARMVPANDQLAVDIEKHSSQDRCEGDGRAAGDRDGRGRGYEGRAQGLRLDERVRATEGGRRVHGARGRGGPVLGRPWSAAVPAARCPRVWTWVPTSVAFFRPNTDTPFKPGHGHP